MTSAEFDDIRPYNDSEIPPVMKRLASDKDLASLILSHKASYIPKWLYPLCYPLAKSRLSKAFSGIVDVKTYQAAVVQQLKQLIANHSHGVLVQGLEALPSSGNLFLSNHRDIAMDPVLVGLSLVDSNRNPMQIAIGDNLLQRPFAADLMRANRAFMVKRAIGNRREKMAALTKLSRYIRVAVTEENDSVWIAQREGRAKDSNDKTDTALLKMLALSRQQDQDLVEAITQLNVIPVAIAYEYDPCDRLKAKELFIKAEHGSYQKEENEDLVSIYTGLVGEKGRMNVAYGKPIANTLESVDAVAEEVDRQIHLNYRLYPSNIFAFEKLGEDSSSLIALYPDEDWPAKRQEFDARLAQVPAEHHPYWLAIYANPVRNYLKAAR